MPWEVTADKIRSGHIPSDEFQPGSFRTIDISKKDGIQAVIGKKTGEKTTSVQSYLFDKEKWTLDKAKEWFDSHKSSEFSSIPSSSPFIVDESRIYRFCSPFLLKEDGDWIQILRTGQWKSPKYGKFKVTPETLEEMKENFDANVRGQKILFDVEHEPKNGSIGEVQDLKIEGNGLWAKATWTTEGKELKDSRKYPYISPEFAPVYEDAETGQKSKNVLLGVAVTTRPFIKHMAPVVSLSEDMEGGNMDFLTSLNEKITSLSLMDYMPEGMSCDKTVQSIMHVMDSFRSLLEAVIHNDELDVTQKLAQAKKILGSLPDQIINMISMGLQTMEMTEEEASFLQECWGERLKLMEAMAKPLDISSLKAALKSHGVKPEDIEKMLMMMKGAVKSSEEEVLDAFDLAVKNFSDLMGQFSEHLKNVGGKNYVMTNMKDLMQKLSDLSTTIKKRREKPVATKANETEEKEGKEVLVPAEVKLSEDQVKSLTEQIREQVAADIAKQYEEKVKALSEEHQAAMQAVEAYKRDHKLRDFEEQIKTFKCTEVSDGIKRQIAPAGVAVLQEVLLELSEETAKKFTEMLAKGIPMVALGEIGSGAEVLGSVDDDQKVIALAEHKRKENPAVPYKQHMLAARKELGVSRKKQAVGGEE